MRYEFGYDRYHANYDKIYRLISHGDGEYLGSTKFAVASAPFADAIRETVKGSELVTRIGRRSEVLIETNGKYFFEPEYHYADPDFFKIFSFDVIAGDREGLLDKPTNIVLCESVAIKLYGSADNAIGRSMTAQHDERGGNRYRSFGTVRPGAPHDQSTDERDRYPENARCRFVVYRAIAFG